MNFIKEITVKGNKFNVHLDDECNFSVTLDDGEMVSAASLEGLKELVRGKVEAVSKSKQKPMEIPVVKYVEASYKGPAHWINGTFRGIHSTSLCWMVRWENKPVEQLRNYQRSEVWRVLTAKEIAKFEKLKRESEEADMRLSDFKESIRFKPPIQERTK